MASINVKCIELKRNKKLENTVDVLDKGYVRLVDHMGSDLSVVNAARVSFAKESEEFDVNDARLVTFLGKHGHTSPFRHAFMTFEVKAPLMVCRQWWKYITGSDHRDPFDGSWNESSRRYVTMDPEFYAPKKDQWRSQPSDKKQGSGGPIGPWDGAVLTDLLEDYAKRGEDLYNYAQSLNVAIEQARLFLPAYGLYVVWRWSCSLQSVCHFLTQRFGDDAQLEIQEYAKGVYDLIQPIFPVSVDALVSYRAVD